MEKQLCALVTGGANGIGRTLVEHFHGLGCAVGVLDRDPVGCAVLRHDYRAYDNVLVLDGDVGCESEVAAAVSAVAARFGRLDGLINNAGGGCGGPDITEWTVERWRAVLDANLTGAFLCTKHAVPHLRAANGSMVNIASTRASQSEANTFAYSAAKGGVVALTHALAVSLGPAIRVNCISPGWIETRPDAHHSEADRTQHPCGRAGVPQDIAELAEFLLDTRRSGFVTGQNFTADGGMGVKMIYAE